MWVTIVLISLVLIGLTVVIGRRRRRMSMLERNGIPGPKPHWLWGNLREYLKAQNVVWDTELINEYGPICGYYLGAKPMILISDPALMEQIQTKHGDDFLDRPRRVPGGINPDPKRAKMLGNLGVADWKSLRSILDKAFSPARLKIMSKDVDTLIQICISRITQDKGSLDFYSLYQDFTLDLIGKTGFGLNSDIQNNPNDGLKKAVEQEFSKSTGSFMLKLFLCLPEVQCILQPIRICIEKMKTKWGLGGHSELWDLGATTVQERKMAIHENGKTSDLLNIMLESGKLGEESVVANSVLFFEAGFETLSASLAFITHLLIKHQDVQEQVRTEIVEVLEETDGKLELNELKKLTVLEAVIKEALRMFPPQTTFIGRSGRVDLSHVYTWNGIEMAVTIPKDVHVQVALYQVLNSEQIWESPRTFKPERFLLVGEDGSRSYEEHEQSVAYQPFGKGKRMCIGRKYADMVLKMLICQLLSKYRLLPSHQTEQGEIEVIYKTATMTPKNGVFGKVVLDPLFKI